jgi:hypothetical protein
MAQAAPEPPGRSSTTLPIDSIYPLYPDEWVLVRIVSRTKPGEVELAEVMAHSPDRQVVSESLIRAHRDHPGIQTYLFAGGPSAASAEGWREELAEAAALGAVNAFW